MNPPESGFPWDLTGLGEPQEPSPSMPRVVVIEDDAMTRQLLTKALLAAGMGCQAVATGREGLDLIHAEPPDLVLLDLLLGDENGFQVCEEIRRTWTAQELPVVVITGLDDFASIEGAYLAGATDYLTKPLNWKHLPYHIRHLLRANQAFKDLLQKTHTLRSFFAAHPDPIFYVDRREHVTLVHASIHSGDEEPPRPLGVLDAFLPEDLALRIRERCQEAWSHPFQVFTLEFAQPFNNRQRFWEGRFISFTPDQVLVMVRDITERKDYEQRIQHMAYHDALTGLRNRRALICTLERVFQEVFRTEGTPGARSAALLYLDLDHFKRINDTLGHALGDDLLKVVAGRLEEVLRPSDLVARNDSQEGEAIARIGGDEFCVVLTHLGDPTDAGKVANRLIDLLKVPILLDGHELVITPSIGIALIPQDGRDPDTLLKNADRAMYAAKDAGRNRVQFFDPAMGNQLRERFALEAGIRRGLAHGAFHVHFQPQIDARTETLLGMEALLRWNDPEMGAISPAKFIPVAEDTGLIVELGEFVLLEALRFCNKLRADGLPPIRVAVNLSSVQMLDPRLLESIESALALTGADPSQLEVEVTESVLLEGSGQAMATLNRLKELGITLALDDFGTGYSSLSYLHRFPFDILKIDQSFVRSLLTTPQSQTLAAAIIAMGHSLGLELVAEGVEHLEQANFLLAKGCHVAQGYLYGRPMGPDAFRDFYAERLRKQPPQA